MSSNRIWTAEELRTTLEERLAALKDRFGADVLTLHLYDPQRDRLYFPVGVGLLQEQRFLRGMPSMDRVAGKIIRSRRYIVADDAEHHADLTGPFTHVERVKSAAGFPLLTPDDQEPVGVLFVDYRTPLEFDGERVASIREEAQDLAGLIDRNLRGDSGRALRDALRMETDLRLEETRLQEILNGLRRTLGQVNVALWVPARGRRSLRVQVQVGLSPNLKDHAAVDLERESLSRIAKAFTDDREIVLEGMGDGLPVALRLPSDVSGLHGLAVPVSSEHRRLGVLTVWGRDREPFTPQEQTLVRVFANLIAVRIESENRIITLNALHDVGVRLTLVTGLEETLQEIVRSACQVIGGDVAVIHLYDPEHKEFYGLERSVVYPDSGREKMDRPRAESGLSAQIIERGRIYQEDVSQHKEVPELSRFVVEQGIEAYIGTPLISVDEPLGVMYVSFREKRQFTAEDLALVQILANYAATAIRNQRMYGSLERNVQELEALQDLSRAISAALNLDEVMRIALQSIHNTLGFEYATVSLVDAERNVIETKHGIWRGELDVFPKWIEMSRYSLDHPDIQADIVRTGQTEIIDAWDERFNREIWDRFDHERLLRIFMPIKFGDEVIGTVEAGFQKETKERIEPQEVRTLQTFVDQVAAAIRNAQLYERARERAQDLSALNEIGQRLTQGIRMREEGILGLIHDQASALMDTENMYIALYDDQTDMVRFGLAYVGGEQVDVENEEGWQPRRSGKGRTEEIIRTGKPLFHITKEEARQWYDEPGREEYIGDPLASWLGVPMMVGEKVIGVVATYHPTRDYVYGKDDLEILQSMANQAAVALDNAHMFYDINQRQEALVDFGREVTRGIRLSEGEILELIHDQASRLMDTENMYIALYDADTDTVRFGLAYVDGEQVDVEHAEGYQPRQAGKGKTEEIIRTREPIFHGTKEEAEKWYEQPGREEYVGAALPSWLGVPMMVGDRVLGVIATYHPEREFVYSGEDLEILKAMADQAAVAIENARLVGELMSAQERIAETEAVVTRMSIAADFVHRLNNLAGTIPFWVGQIRTHLGDQVQSDQKLARYLGNIEDNTDSLLRAAERLKSPPGESHIDVEVILESLVRQALVQMPAKVDIDLECDDDLPLLYGTPSDVTNAFWSIMENGIDAMPDGGRLTVLARRSTAPDGGEWVEVEIRDEGQGVPEEVGEEIFRPFYTTKEGHMGYGLWRARNLFERMGGSIDFESVDGEGTAFTIRLPAPTEDIEDER